MKNTDTTSPMTLTELRKAVKEVHPRAMVVLYGSGKAFLNYPDGTYRVHIGFDTRYNGPRFLETTGVGSTKAEAAQNAADNFRANASWLGGR